MREEMDVEIEDELSELEDELYSLVPRAVPVGFCESMMAKLCGGEEMGSESVVGVVDVDKRPRRRNMLGFMPAAAAAVVVACVVWLIQPEGGLEGIGDTASSFASMEGEGGLVDLEVDGVRRLDRDPVQIPIEQFERVSLGDSLRDAQPEGFHYENGQVYRQVRYRYDKVVVLKHPEDGTVVRLSVPQEEVHLEPVKTN